MRAQFRAAAAVTLIAFCAAVYSTAQENPAAQPQAEQPPSDSGKAPGGGTREPTLTVLDHHEVQGILGKEVRSAADEDMGGSSTSSWIKMGRSGQPSSTSAASSASAAARSRLHGMRCDSYRLQKKASTLRWS
jgi:hypothetical protein